MAEHHRRAQAERAEDALEDAVGEASFDLAADIAHPTAGRAEAGYDVDADLGMEPR
ncbi:hypothetical protein [Streptomyces milbemycinicus]|uniref:Uncharacterized protein n=1 Tax=Streptomyces milbemycinicus TaxID=476552 RepID=A0ABW8LGY3_9ACTN